MGAQIIRGNALQIPLADQSVHCIVTSPPYWGLRDYGVAGQIGLEPTFDEYLQTMLAVMRECKRVLRNDGTLWLNMGDGYAGSGKGLNGDGSPGVLSSDKQRSNEGANNAVKTRAAGGLKPKDLIGQPWALAFALRADGWYLRSDIIWHKPAPMPESVSDRPTKSHEYLFLLSKSEKYFFDQAAWREPCSDPMGMPREGANSGMNVDRVPRQRKVKRSGNVARKMGSERGAPAGNHLGGSVPWEGSTRNRRTVWTIGSQPTPEAHFATFPEALVEPCLLAGCPKYCCSTCGQGWEPIEEKTGGSIGKGDWTDKSKTASQGKGGMETAAKAAGRNGYRIELKGYAPACACPIQNSELSIQHCAGTAFDPFSGSGTVCAVAHRMGYNGIGLELNPAYIEIAKRRIFADVTPTRKKKPKASAWCSHEPEIVQMNYGKIILSIYDHSGGWSQPYLEAGYDVRRVDIQDGIDARLFEFVENVHGIILQPPCTEFAVSGAQWWAGKGEQALIEALELVSTGLRFVATAKRLAWWVLENPIGRINRWIGPPLFQFDPCDFAGYADNPQEDAHTKRTCLWGKFNIPQPRWVQPVGNRPGMPNEWYSKVGGKSIATKNYRSKTPQGFARAFFAANP